MRTNFTTILFTLSFITSTTLQFTNSKPNFPQFTDDEKTRRILHQPLFTTTTQPPPLPPPPPPPIPPEQDQPFFHELPAGTTPDQTQQLPQPISGAAAQIPAATHPSSPTKTLAIAISSGILTFAMVSALAYYMYKNRGKKTDGSQKLFHTNPLGITNQDSRIQPSNFLYIGTVEPTQQSTTNSITESNNCNNGVSSPYRKLNPGKISDRYRPSPELQPLPPLPPPPIIHSPPPMSSSEDDETQDRNFYTPQESSVSNESPNSRKNSNQLNRVPHSKRTSPKSRLSVSSPDTKLIKALSYTPKRAKFPPPPPDIARLRSISGDENENQTCKIPIPIPIPPPPPPPLSLSMPRKYNPVETYSPFSISKQLIANPVDEKKSSYVDKSASSSEIMDTEEDGSKPKLKPLHWDKVRATSDRATVWDQLKSSSFQLNEDAMESLFMCNSTNSVPKEATRKPTIPSLEQENRVLDPKKSQNIAILLRALNVTREEVSEALLNGNPDGLGPELLETLVKMAPTKEEEIKLRGYNGNISKLGSAERFLKSILDIPFAFKRVEAMLYRANFDTEIKYLRKSFQTLEDASEELKNSRLFLKLLEAVLRTGNHMNNGTNRGHATSFKLDTLLKLVDIKGTDGKTTLLHFVVQEMIKSEHDTSIEILPNKTSFKCQEHGFMHQGLQVVAGLSKELSNVKRAAGMDSVVLNSYLLKLESGLEKVKNVLKYENQTTEGEFFNSMRGFLDESFVEIAKIKGEEKKALLKVRGATEYFHGNAAKEEAHPFRIFVIVRDFLLVLDNVCKDVGKIQARATVGAGRSFRMPVTAALPVLNRYNVRHDGSSDDDSM